MLRCLLLKKSQGLDDEIFSLYTQIEDFTLTLVSRNRRRLGRLHRRQADTGVFNTVLFCRNSNTRRQVKIRHEHVVKHVAIKVIRAHACECYVNVYDPAYVSLVCMHVHHVCMCTSLHAYA